MEDGTTMPGSESAAAAAASLSHAEVFDERGFRAYCRDIWRRDRTIYDAHTDAQLRRGYQNFRRYCRDQTEIRSHEYNSEIIKNTFAKLSNLTIIKLSIGRRSTYKTSTLDRAFGKGLIMPYGDDDQQAVLGVPQLRSLLLAAEHTGLNVKHLECGSVRWPFFEQDSESFEKIKKAVNTLTTFIIHIAGHCEDTDGDEPGSRPPSHDKRYLASRGRLVELFTAAPNLKHLEVNFCRCKHFFPGAKLRDIVGGFQWPYLTSVAFASIQTNQNDLLALFKTHLKTLRKISLTDISLFFGGRWLTLWENMRALRFEKVTMAGIMASRTEYHDLGLEYNGKVSHARAVIEAYLNSRVENDITLEDQINGLEVPGDWMIDS